MPGGIAPVRRRGSGDRDPVPRPSDGGRGRRQPCRMTASPLLPPRPDGALARAVRRAAGAAAARPRTAIALWLVLVVGCVMAGGMAGTRTLTETEAGVGESARADERIEAAGLRDPAVESVLVRSGDAQATRAAADELVARLDRAPAVRSVQGPREAPELSTAGGRAVLVQAKLRGDPDAAENSKSVRDAVAAVAPEHAGVTLQQAGAGSFDHAIEELIAEDLQKAEFISLPITLLILLVAFGAVVAAIVPLVLGITAVAAAMGAVGVLSQFAPTSETTASVVVLIGLAVGVDYSLFYIRREREERRAGRSESAALDAAAATVGRAILVSGLTVIVAVAGLLLSGSAIFISMGVASMLVVAIAVLGSLTVLPAMLALLGDRVDRGRLPFAARRARRAAAGQWLLGAQRGRRDAAPGGGARHLRLPARRARRAGRRPRHGRLARRVAAARPAGRPGAGRDRALVPRRAVDGAAGRHGRGAGRRAPRAPAARRAGG